jgi:hypothetical protein
MMSILKARVEGPGLMEGGVWIVGIAALAGLVRVF